MDFVEARRKYGLFVAQYKAGKISAQELEKEVSQLEVIDQYKNRWQLGVKSAKWYRLDGTVWIEDLPPPPPAPSIPQIQADLFAPPPPPAAPPPAPPPSQTAHADPLSRRRRIQPPPPVSFQKTRKRRGCMITVLILVILVGIIGCLVMLVIGGIIYLEPEIIPFNIQLSSTGTKTIPTIQNLNDVTICSLYLFPFSKTRDEFLV